MKAKTLKIRLFGIIAGAFGMLGCAEQNAEVQRPLPQAGNFEEFVEKAAIEHAMQGTTLELKNFKAQAEKKDGYWLVKVSLVPEVPSGYIYYEVTEDGTVKNFAESEFIRVLSQNHDQ